MKNKTLTISFLLSIITFLLVTFVFTLENGYVYDSFIMDKISAISSKSLISFMELISLFGSSEIILIITVLIGLLLLLRKKWFHLILFFVLSAGGVALNFALKMAFQRERPDGESTMIEVFNYSLEIPSYSFPSGHTMRATILLLFILYLAAHYLMKNAFRTSLYILVIMTIIGVALSRLFLEAHFFSDTIAAISISVAWFALVIFIYNKLTGKKKVSYHRVIGM